MEKKVKLQIPVIDEKEFAVTTLRRRPKKVYTYLEALGHTAIITRHGKRELAMMSAETYLAETEPFADAKTKQNREEFIRIMDTE